MVEEVSGYDATSGAKSSTSSRRRGPRSRLFDMCRAPVARRAAPVRARRVVVPRTRSDGRSPGVDPAAGDRVGRRGRARGSRTDRACAAPAGDRRSTPDPSDRVVDLGTGSGAIALALEAALPDVEVWATDAERGRARRGARRTSPAARRTRVRLARGSWFDALPGRAAGSGALAGVEPAVRRGGRSRRLAGRGRGLRAARRARSRPDGTEALEIIAGGARGVARCRCSFVCELAPHQAAADELVRVVLGYVGVVRA